MRVFKKPNLSGDWKCPICNTSEIKEVVLIEIEGTEDGKTMGAEQVHLDCLNLTLSKEKKIIYQSIK